MKCRKVGVDYVGGGRFVRLLVFMDGNKTVTAARRMRGGCRRFIEGNGYQLGTQVITGQLPAKLTVTWQLPEPSLKLSPLRAGSTKVLPKL